MPINKFNIIVWYPGICILIGILLFLFSFRLYIEFIHHCPFAYQYNILYNIILRFYHYNKVIINNSQDEAIMFTQIKTEVHKKKHCFGPRNWNRIIFQQIIIILLIKRSIVLINEQTDKPRCILIKIIGYSFNKLTLKRK